MSNQVYVTNKNPEPHVDRFDGEDFYFAPNQQVLVPIEAATHLFGYGLADKTDTLVRLGWAMKYDPTVKNFVEDEQGVKRLANFVFEEAVMTPKTLLPASLPSELEIA
jgi:hypothetical protein